MGIKGFNKTSDDFNAKYFKVLIKYLQESEDYMLENWGMAQELDLQNALTQDFKRVENVEKDDV